jgi:hypothetical protein
MTHLTLRFQEQDEPVTVDFFHATSTNKDLQEHMDKLLAVQPIKPMVNAEAWLAQLLMSWFGGTKIDGPDFEPEAGNVA